MSAFTFNFDLEDDLDKSFDAIPPQEPAAVPSIDKKLVSEGGSGGEIPAEEITLSALVRDNFGFFIVGHPLLQSYPIRQRSSPLSPKHSRIHP